MSKTKGMKRINRLLGVNEPHYLKCEKCNKLFDENDLDLHGGKLICRGCEW